jgi:methyltransferase (TIGR00027 family)
MRDGSPSLTAQRVAARRLTFERLEAPFGDPEADVRLAEDVAGGVELDSDADDPMVRYLRGRTGFFDRVVVNGLGRGVMQVLAVGAGYDGRSLRYAKPEVTWFEVDHPETQQDKRNRLERLGIATSGVVFVPADLQREGLAAELFERGYEPEMPSLILCEGVLVYLHPATIATLFAELRATATPGTRFAFTASTQPQSERGQETRALFREAVARAGEPVRNMLDAGQLAELLEATRWRRVEMSDGADRAGFCVATPEF